MAGFLLILVIDSHTALLAAIFVFCKDISKFGYNSSKYTCKVLFKNNENKRKSNLNVEFKYLSNLPGREGGVGLGKGNILASLDLGTSKMCCMIGEVTRSEI